MKKLFAMMLAMILLLSVAALAEAADYTGVWYLNSMEAEGQAFNPADLGLEMSFDFKEDGTVHATSGMAGDIDEGEGTWTIEGDTLTVTLENTESPLTLTVEDGALVGMEGSTKMIFGREAPEADAYEPAATVAAEAADFEGTWTAIKYGMDGSYMDAALLGMDMTAEIKDGSVKLTGFFGSDVPVPLTFSDGAYTFETDDEGEMFAGIKVEMLEDGDLLVSLYTGENAVVVIMTRADAA